MIGCKPIVIYYGTLFINAQYSSNLVNLIPINSGLVFARSGPIFYVDQLSCLMLYSHYYKINLGVVITSNTNRTQKQKAKSAKIVINRSMIQTLANSSSKRNYVNLLFINGTVYVTSCYFGNEIPLLSLTAIHYIQVALPWRATVDCTWIHDNPTWLPRWDKQKCCCTTIREFPY